MRKLRKSEINRIIKENATLSNTDLLDKYFDLVYNDVLGSRPIERKKRDMKSLTSTSVENMKTTWTATPIFFMGCFWSAV